jgi:phage tail-like protein
MSRKTWFLILVVFVPATLFAQRSTPLQTSSFALSAPGVGAGTAFFKEVTGLTSESDVVEYREGGAQQTTRKIPGANKWGNITLKRGLTSDVSLWTWRKLVEDGQFEQARKNCTIILQNASGQPVAQWTLVNAWPSKVSMETDPESGQPMEVIVLAVDGIRRP